ncbi:MAG TPA: hypothetical protein VGH29_20720 [Candidatus Binataceae bacterium]|jgi:hypothetical protein
MAVTKGIRTRSSPDWYAQYLSVAGAGNSDNPGTQAYKYFGLLNNSTTGYYLAVYAFQVTSNISPLFDLFWVRETIGARVNFASRINPLLPAPPGEVFYLNNGATPVLQNPFVTVGAFTPTNSGGNWPLFIIPPQWALYGAAPGGDDRSGLSWFFVPMADTKCTQAV